MHGLALNYMLREAVVEAIPAHLGEVASDSDHVCCCLSLLWPTLMTPYLVRLEAHSGCKRQAVLHVGSAAQLPLLLLHFKQRPRALDILSLTEGSSIRRNSL